MEILNNFSFAKNTTYGCGGVADVAYFPQSIAEAKAVYDKVKSEGRKYYILGNGSDVLAQDSFYDGSVIVTKRLGKIKILSGGRIFCESGVTVPCLLECCRNNGLGGLEYLSGIPATAGGLCYMNAGAAGRYIGGNIVNVVIYDGKTRILSQKMCNFDYKYSTMRDINCLILGCTLQAEISTRQKITDNCRYYYNRRKYLPKGKSCGCVFKNPEGKNAGALIEAAGLKGLTCGKAGVSHEHANFIINYGDCSQDVYNLITLVKRRVYEMFATELEEEVCYIGDFK